MSNSPGTKSNVSNKKTNRPSLMVVADGKETNFQRRPYNPNELNPKFVTGNNLNFSDNDSDDSDSNDNYGSRHKKNNGNSSDDEMSPNYLPDDIDLDARSTASTSAFSIALEPEEMLDKLKDQLDFSEFGDFFSSLFGDMDISKQRQLARFGRLQIVKKKNWLQQIWNLFDPLFNGEGDEDDDDNNNNGEGGDGNGKSKNKNKNNLSSKLLGILELFIQMDNDPESLSPEFTNDPYAYCLNQAAQKALNGFIFSDIGGLSLFMRAAIIGPAGSGKSVYLRFIFMRILLFLVESGRFKDFLLIPFDFKNHNISSVETFYYYFTEKVIDALIVQRPDLQLFERSFKKAFATLPKIAKIKHLPKPHSSQDYLRHPLKQVEHVLIRMHYCYNNPKLVDAFLTNIVLLPQTLATIFSFRTPFYLIDHLDAIDIEIKQVKGKPPIQLLEFIKFGLTKAQYLISCFDGETFSEKLNAMDEDSVDIRNQTQNIYVYDCVLSKFKGQSIQITFDKSSAQTNLILSDSHCGGCASFINRYDEICEMINDMNNATSKIKMREEKVKLMKALNDYIEDMYDFDELPKIKKVELINSSDKDSGYQDNDK